MFFFLDFEEGYSEIESNVIFNSIYGVWHTHYNSVEQRRSCRSIGVLIGGGFARWNNFRYKDLVSLASLVAG